MPTPLPTRSSRPNAIEGDERRFYVNLGLAAMLTAMVLSLTAYRYAPNCTDGNDTFLVDVELGGICR